MPSLMNRAIISRDAKYFRGLCCHVNMAGSIITACERGDADEVQRLISLGQDLQNVKDADGWTLVDIVVRCVVL